MRLICKNVGCKHNEFNHCRLNKAIINKDATYGCEQFEHIDESHSNIRGSLVESSEDIKNLKKRRESHS